MLPQISFVPIGCPDLPREEVPILVAKELTNRQIVSELMLSDHTVATHVAKILREVGLNTHSQLTTWVAKRRTPP
jgi:DNA-binding NarL/FixJ family response regulator